MGSARDFVKAPLPTAPSGYTANLSYLYEVLCVLLNVVVVAISAAVDGADPTAVLLDEVINGAAPTAVDDSVDVDQRPSKSDRRMSSKKSRSDRPMNLQSSLRKISGLLPSSAGWEDASPDPSVMK